MTRAPGEAEREPEYPSPAIVGSRRLMGPNLMHAGLGAVLDVRLDDADPERNTALLRRWHERVSFIADALGWTDAETSERVYAGGASLFVQAPIDQLMTATEVCESAWVFAERHDDAGAASDGDASLDKAIASAAAERRPVLTALWHEAQRRGINCTFDDAHAAVGSGPHVKHWSLDDIPPVDAIDWSAVHDIPIVLVTGSNGKTTVVRMVAAMARAAGHTVGYTCTDGVWVGGERVESGDWSGPAGARRVLQDASVSLAVLETARGGILRRGLAVQRAAVAAIITLSPDHFGDYGINDLDALAAAKLVVGRAVSETGGLVYNADVPQLRTATASYSGRKLWVSIEPELLDAKAQRRKDATSPGAKAAVSSGQSGFSLEQHNKKIDLNSVGDAGVADSTDLLAPLRLCAFASGSSVSLGMTVAELEQIPAALGGRAVHNVLNGALALAIAHELQLGPAAIEALKRFGRDPRENMGRLMVYHVGGVTLVIDYAHNPQSVTALIDATRGITAERRAITLGTGGDRDDHALQQIAAAAVGSNVIDLYIAKEMPKFLRGRPTGAISGAFITALRALGVSDSQMLAVSGDLDAVRHALQWAQAGDLLLLAVHDERDEVLALVDRLVRTVWQPGTALPD